jgi:hypothetical protein
MHYDIGAMKRSDLQDDCRLDRRADHRRKRATLDSRLVHIAGRFAQLASVGLHGSGEESARGPSQKVAQRLSGDPCSRARSCRAGSGSPLSPPRGRPADG